MLDGVDSRMWFLNWHRRLEANRDVINACNDYFVVVGDGDTGKNLCNGLASLTASLRESKGPQFEVVTDLGRGSSAVWLYEMTRHFLPGWRAEKLTPATISERFAAVESGLSFSPQEPVNHAVYAAFRLGHDLFGAPRLVPDLVQDSIVEVLEASREANRLKWGRAVKLELEDGPLLPDAGTFAVVLFVCEGLRLALGGATEVLA